MFEFIKKALSGSNDAEIKRLRKTVEQINALEGQMQKLSDEEMRAWAAQLPWPVLRVDGTRPVQALVPEICTWISETTGL